MASTEDLNLAYPETIELIDRALSPFENEFQFIAKSEVSRYYKELAEELESLNP